MNIRRKKITDCEVWVDINIKSWNDNLKGIVSDRVLKIISDNRDSRIERDINNFKIDDWNYVLEENDNVVGILKIMKIVLKCKFYIYILIKKERDMVSA